jgi:MSHA biogenesis protein MshG
MFVIPSFAGIFSRFHAELPWATKVLLAMSTFFQHFWWLLLIALVALVFGLRYWVSTSQGRMVWHHYQLKMPIIGSILQRALMARFCRCLAMMLRSGVPINQAMHLVAEAVDNVYISAHIQAMRTGVESGESLLQTALGSKLFTPLVIQMIAVGEETGQIDTLMQESAEYYEREVDYDLQTLTSKIEPILIVMVAIMVLILALGIFTPMWDMMRVFKGQ